MPLNDFVPFDPSGSLLLEERLHALPRDSVIKGMFFQPLLAEAQRVLPGVFATRSYAALTNYPASEFVRLAAETAHLVYPELPPREGLRRLGRLHQGAITEHTVGRALRSAAGSFLETALGLLPHVYKLLAPDASAKILELNSFSAVISLKNNWGFADCYQVGVFEGIFEAFQVEGDVWVRSHSFSDIDVTLFWRRKRA